MEKIDGEVKKAKEEVNLNNSLVKLYAILLSASLLVAIVLVVYILGNLQLVLEGVRSGSRNQTLRYIFAGTKVGLIFAFLAFILKMYMYSQKD